MQSKRYDSTALNAKIEHLLQNCPELRGMKITQGMLSLEDM